MGKDPMKWKSFGFKASPEVMKTYYAVEVALLDLVGKYEGCSISELMGGRVRSTIKLYGSARNVYVAGEVCRGSNGDSADGFFCLQNATGFRSGR